MAERVLCSSCTDPARALFSCLSSEQRSRLKGAVIPHAYRAGDTLFHEGTPALAVCCIRSGSIKLFRRLYGGQEVVIGVRRAGDLAGLRGVLARVPYANTAVTLEPTVACTIAAEDILRLARENPPLSLLLLARISLESRLIEERLVDLTHSRVAQRASRFVVQMVHQRASALPAGADHGLSMNREEMARLIGTTPETLSRTLRALAREGLLSMDRRRILVLDMPGLQRRAH
jgi:CRP/FNR family transcriptional regulator, polysaccharide utilization system transcription regulator